MNKKKKTEPEELLPPARLEQPAAVEPELPPTTIDHARADHCRSAVAIMPPHLTCWGPHVGQGKRASPLVGGAGVPPVRRARLCDRPRDRHAHGVWARWIRRAFLKARSPADEPFAYRLIVADAEGNEYELEDPFRFRQWLMTDFDIYLHGEGNFFDSYTKFGAQLREIQGVHGREFRRVGAQCAARERDG